jgi:twitching motility protein PilT
VAVIDRYLEALTRHKGEALLLRPGSPVEMVIGGNPRPATNKAVSEEQIMSLLSEALGADYAPGVSGRRTYAYDSPAGHASVQVEDGMMGLSVRILFASGAAAPVSAGPPSVSLPATPTPAPIPFQPTPPPVITGPPSRAAAASAHTSASASVSAPAAAAGALPGHMDDLFHQMMDMKASDLHLKSSKGPMLRVDGSMTEMPNRAPIGPAELHILLDAITPERNRAEFRDTNDTDFAYELHNRDGNGVRARMRCNVFRDIAGVGAVFRQIPSKILTAEQLKLPKACLDFCQYDKGLVVVTGPTGSGKSTTLAAMIDWINANRDDHIITIEDRSSSCTRTRSA